ncbi:hypothetical protein [Plantibacter sp. RU18]|uniref:hypothetical protein n=1 Tax=Plantibacter sp. RU18 TaxID=3158143 RepID=UPI003D364ED3
MTANHGGERTGEQAGAFASVRGGGVGGDVSFALQLLRGDDPVLEVPAGDVHAVLGASAATRRFIAGLSGTSGAREGSGETVLVGGKAARLSSRAASSAAGIALVSGGHAISWPQSIGENVLLGNERAPGILDALARLFGRRPEPGTHLNDAERASRALGIVGLERAQAEPVSALTTVERRLLELARAVAAEAAVVVVDDTGAGVVGTELTRWRRALLAVAATPRPHGPAPAVILVTGTVTGLASVASRATVLAGTAASPPTRMLVLASAADEAAVLGALAVSFGDGGVATDPLPADPGFALGTSAGFAVEDWTASHPADASRTVVDRLSFACAPGEVLGLFGPPDSGAGEVLLSVFGRSYGAHISGAARVDGEVVDVSTTDLARAAGILYTTEHPIRFDLSFLGGLPSSVSPESLTRMVSTGVADARRDYQATTVPTGLVAAIPGAHRGPSADQFSESLSMLVGSTARVVLLAEPFGSEGDDRARDRRRAVIGSLAEGGRSVVVASEDPGALAAVCDRVIAVRGGRIVGETSADRSGGGPPISALAIVETMGGIA